ncbi:MAG TPA: AMP-binding protein [Steroidobacteraceae bacterium]|nr:AMP-binding protein [Steroidobacteraceae bacterium]
MTTPVDCIAFHARLTPQRLAARDLVHGREYRYIEFDRLIGQLATALTARGISVGERVAVLARNSAWQVALHFACARIGAIYVPLNWRLSSAEITTQLARIRPRLLLGDALAQALPQAEALAEFAHAAEALAPLAATTIDPARPSLVLFTSGTSGHSKGVMLTEGNLQHSAWNFATCTRVDGNSSFLCEGPMFHVIGLIANVRPVLTQGGSIQVSDGFEPARTLAWLMDPSLGISHYGGVPQMLLALRKQPGFDPARLRRVTALMTGGAPHAVEDIAAWLEDGVPMVSGFGMSETGTVFGMPVDREMIRAKLGSVGVPAPGMQTRVVDAQGRDCAAHTPGELLLRGPNLTPGYWQEPEETAKSIDTEGWLHTGDIVRYDEDDFFWIVDRKKDMYISGGENVYPAEIEAALGEHPGIAECAVVGVPDPQWGEVGYLAIVPVHADLDTADVLEFLGARLARYKLPRHVHFVAALPRTATGKLQKAQLKEMVRELER